MPLAEAKDVVVIGAAKSVNRLGVVAHGRQVAGSRRRHRLDHPDLHGVGVLHLVDQNVPEHPGLELATARETRWINRPHWMSRSS